MDEKTRQRIWLSAVVVLGVTVCVQYLNNRDLRSELARTRIDPAELQQRVDQRAAKARGGRRARPPSRHDRRRPVAALVLSVRRGLEET